MLVKLIKEASLYGWHVLASADVSAKVKVTITNLRSFGIIP